MRCLGIFCALLRFPGSVRLLPTLKLPGWQNAYPAEVSRHNQESGCNLMPYRLLISWASLLRFCSSKLQSRLCCVSGDQYIFKLFRTQVIAVKDDMSRT